MKRRFVPAKAKARVKKTLNNTKTININPVTYRGGVRL